MSSKKETLFETRGTSNAIRRRESKQPNILLNTLNDYCDSSSIHGISYLKDKDKTCFEKVWWGIMIAISVGVCTYFMIETWTKWKTDPVIVSFDKEQTSIWEIPFPAVTICPLNKVDQKVFNYTEFFRRRDNLNEDEYKMFWDLSLICNLEQYNEATEFTSDIVFTDESVIKIIKQVAPTLNDTIWDIKWQNQILPQDVFAEQITEDGLCFTFNSFSQQDIYTTEINNDTLFISHGKSFGTWNLEQGYSNENDGPLRTARDGSSAGLSLNLYSTSDSTDFVCGAPISGYKILLHDPHEPPRMTQKYFLVPINHLVVKNVRPELIQTSKNFEYIQPHIRKCYFSNERSLRFFRTYTQNNCRVECDANATQHYCGCVPFYTPRDNKTPICGFGKIKCVEEIESIIMHIEMMKYSASNRSLIEIQNILKKCQCLPSCTSLRYTAENSDTETHYIKSVLHSGLFDAGLSEEQKQYYANGILTYSRVEIFFKENQFVALKRQELFGPDDFIANCGGLLGLFMGVSLLSLLEIVYFFTLRLWFKYRNGRICNENR